MAPDEASSLGTGGPKRRLAPHCAGLLSHWFCQGGGLQALGLLVRPWYCASAFAAVSPSAAHGIYGGSGSLSHRIRVVGVSTNAA